MKIRLCLPVLCFLVFYCSAAHGQTANWEYKQLYTENGLPLSDEVLNHYAKYGWEIASTTGKESNTTYRIFLKRSRSHPLFGTKTPEPPPTQPPPPPTPTFNLNLAQAPPIRGLRLGMTSDVDRAQQLKSAELAPNYGYLSLNIDPSNYATGDRFTGIGSFNFRLFDGKVVSTYANYYQNSPYFENTGQLMEIITKQLGLPEFKDWPGYNEYSQNLSLYCEGFNFYVEVNQTRVNFVQLS